MFTGIGSFLCPCIPGYNGWIKAELYYSDSGNVFAGKGAEYSSESQVEVLSQDGQTVIALYEEGDSDYVTYIYLYKGKLRELFTKKGRDVVWSSGQELVSADTFSVTKQKEDLLQIELSGDGQEELLYIRIYGEDSK